MFIPCPFEHFFPSTLGGSCFSTDTGKVDKENYNRNMDLATDVYISCANHCPCGETVINLYKGADSSEKQEVRKILIQYLKGSKQQQESIKHDHPELYHYFKQVWAIRERHMVTSLPTQCIFFLLVVLNLTAFTPFASLRISPIIQLGTVEDLWFRTSLCPFLTPVDLGVEQIVMSAKGYAMVIS